MNSKRSFLFFFKTFNSFVGISLFSLIFFTILISFLDGVGITLFIPLLKGKNFNYPFFNKLLNNFELNLLIIGTVFTIKSITHFFYMRYLTRVIFKTKEELTKKFFQKILNLNYLTLINEKRGFYNNLLTVEIPKFSLALRSFASLTSHIFSTLIYTSISLVLNPIFTTWAIAISIMLALSLRYFQKIVETFSKEHTKQNGILNNFILQTLKSIKYIKATNLKAIMNQKLSHTTKKIFLLNTKIGETNGMISSIIEPIAIIILLSTIFIQVKISKVEISTILVSALIFYKALNSLFRLFPNLNYFSSQFGSIDIVLKSYHSLSSNASVKFKRDQKKFLKIENISFSYPNEIEIFKDFTIEFQKNSITGLKAESGKGKSTLLNIISGIITPAHGAISSNFKNLGYVPQEDSLFNDTIINNITLWETYPVKALSLSCLKFTDNLADKLNSRIDDDGLNLSGGQRQLIALAREINRTPDLLLLDEPTNSLDKESIELIKKILLKIREKTTIIITSHDDNLLSICDNIKSI